MSNRQDTVNYSTVLGTQRISAILSIRVFCMTQFVGGRGMHELQLLCNIMNDSQLDKTDGCFGIVHVSKAHSYFDFSLYNHLPHKLQRPKAPATAVTASPHRG